MELTKLERDILKIVQGTIDLDPPVRLYHEERARFQDLMSHTFALNLQFGVDHEDMFRVWVCHGHGEGRFFAESIRPQFKNWTTLNKDLSRLIKQYLEWKQSKSSS